MKEQQAPAAEPQPERSKRPRLVRVLNPDATRASITMAAVLGGIVAGVGFSLMVHFQFGGFSILLLLAIPFVIAFGAFLGAIVEWQD